MYFNSDDLLKAEHKLLVDAVADQGADSLFTNGYVTGIVALAEEMVTKEKEGDDG